MFAIISVCSYKYDNMCVTNKVFSNELISLLHVCPHYINIKILLEQHSPVLTCFPATSAVVFKENMAMCKKGGAGRQKVTPCHLQLRLSSAEAFSAAAFSIFKHFKLSPDPAALEV